jgi:hypothetical protein
MHLFRKKSFQTTCALGIATLTAYNNRYKFSAEGRTEPRKLPPVRKINLIDDQLNLVPTEAEFNEFIKGYGSLFVVAIAGGYGQGKSTLINELYEQQLEGIQLETSDKDGHCTTGITAVLIPHHQESEHAVDIPDYVDETTRVEKVKLSDAKNVGLLVLDTEGLHGPGDSNISKGDFLLLRLMRVANVIVLNTHAELSSLQFKEMSRLNNVIAAEFPELDTDRKPFLIVFQQRTSRPVRHKNGLLRFFPGGVFPYKLFFDHIVLWSPDNLSPHGPNGIRLDVSELRQELKEVQRHKREGGYAIRPHEFWRRLEWVHENTPTTLEIDKADATPYPCHYYCVLCQHNCDRKNVRNHPIHRAPESRDCTSHERAKELGVTPKVNFKCRQCAEISERLTLATAEPVAVTSPYYGILKGHQYECKHRHGVIARDYAFECSWGIPFRRIEDPKKQANIAKFNEHEWRLRGEPKH